MCVPEGKGLLNVAPGIETSLAERMSKFLHEGFLPHAFHQKFERFFVANWGCKEDTHTK
jgi:hypothetical protein